MPTLAESLATRAQTTGQTVISNLSPWYQNGVFYQSNMLNYYLNTLAPAALMATLAKYATNPTLASTYTTMVGEIVDHAIATNTNAAGLFTQGSADGVQVGQGPDQQSMGTTFGDLPAIECVAFIGWILNQLPGGPSNSRWLACCQANCNQLDQVTKDTTYYINGNYNVHLLNAYWFTAAATPAGAQRKVYEDMYERALAFIQNPAATDPVKWAGYGLIIDTPGVQYDWSDYVVHLSETNGYVGPSPAATWDPFYSQLQLDLLARLFVVNRDYRIGRLMNGIANKLEPLINATGWIVDCSGGSRKNAPGQGFQGSWYAITSMLACKAANQTLLDSTHILASWDNSTSGILTGQSTLGIFPPGQFRQIGIVPAVIREASQRAQFKVAAS